MQGRRGRACAALTNSPADSPLAEPCLNTVLELVGCSTEGQAALSSAAVGPWPGDPCSSAAGRWRPFPLRGPGGHSQGLTRPGHQTLPKTHLGRSQHQARPGLRVPRALQGACKGVEPGWLGEKLTEAAGTFLHSGGRVGPKDQRQLSPLQGCPWRRQTGQGHAGAGGADKAA